MINPEFQIGDRVICRALDYRSDDDQVVGIENVKEGDAFVDDIGRTIEHFGADTFLYQIISKPDVYFSDKVLFPYQEAHSDDFSTMIEKLNNYTVPA